MRINIKIDSNLAKANLRKWGGEFRQKVRAVVEKSLALEAKALQQEVREHVGGRLKVAKKAFLKGFRTKVYANNPDRLPALHVGAKIPWAGMHESGGSIAGKMLIPIYGRVGRKRFKQIVTELIRGGNAFFVKGKNGNVVLMAENLKEHDRPLAGFKRRYRKGEGVKRLKRGMDIPIAVLVPRVTLMKRLDVGRLVMGRVPELVAGIEKGLRSLG